MIYEFICYPHEVCYRPHETIGHCYQERDFIESVVDDYSFINAPIGDGFNKVGRDDFDLLVRDSEKARVFVINELRSICDAFIDSLGSGSYAFNLHHLDVNEDGEPLKPHFHCIFFVDERQHTLSINSFYDMLGMFSYVRDDFEKRGKHYQRLKRTYPRSPLARVFIYQDFMRSARLRYLVHLDNRDKYQYPLTSPIASFRYADDPDVQNSARLTPFALFLGYKQRYKLDDEVLWFEWLASAQLPDDIRKQLGTIKTDIHRYYVAFYYRINKNSRSYT